MEEVDLIQVIRTFFQKVYENLRQVVLIVLCSLIIAVILYFVMPTRYTSSFTASCNLIRIEALEQVVSNLKLAVKDRDYGLLASKLAMTEAEVSLITDVDFVEVRPSNIASTELNDLFIVEVKLSDRTDLSSLQRAIVEYVANNEIISEVSSAYMQSSRSNLERVNNEISMLELTRSKLMENEFKTQNFILVNPSDINDKLVLLTRQKNDLVREITLFKPIRVLQPFSELSKPYFPRLSHFLLGGLILSAIASWFYLIFKR